LSQLERGWRRFGPSSGAAQRAAGAGWRHQNGRTYHNQYHFLFILRDGKIVRMKEYLDTMLAHEFLVPNP
jgi:ketosteroid isomerase-like protein